jgi:hypothetical protein
LLARFVGVRTASAGAAATSGGAGMADEFATLPSSRPEPQLTLEQAVSTNMVATTTNELVFRIITSRL